MNTGRKSKINSALKTNFNKSQASFTQMYSVLDQGHFVRPTKHVCLISQKYQILCQGQGKDGLKLAQHITQFLQKSIKHLVNKQSLLNELQRSQLASNNTQSLQQKQKYMILNLIDSCFQDLSELNYEGSCSFCIVYFIGKQIFIVKNDQISVYLVLKKNILEKQKLELKNIGVQTQRRVKTDQTLGLAEQSKLSLKLSNEGKSARFFFYCNKKYENLIKSRYFPSVTFCNYKLESFNDSSAKILQTYLLLGSSLCFFHFSQNNLLQYFSKHFLESYFKQSTEQNNNKQKIQIKSEIISNKINTEQICKQIVKECRKQWKTIYQHDISLITSKIK